MQRIGRYEVVRPLGRGGMGQVFLASDPTLERQVALKLLVHETDPQARALMKDEAKALAALSHPNIVTIFEIGDDGGQLFIAMEYLPGKSLREVLQDDHPSRDRLLDICAQVAVAVDAAHAANILHRDIKPENVVVGKTGVKVVDFGIARRMDRASLPSIKQPARARATEIVDAFMRTMIPEPANSTIETEAPAITSLTQTMFGTPAYMAPEVLGGEPTSNASDVYSLGVMLHECLTGRRPHDAPNLAEMIARAIDGTEPVPRIDDPLGELVEQMLDRDPANRPALAAIARTLTRRRSTISAPPPRRRWAPFAIGGLAVLAIAAVAVFGISRSQSPTPDAPAPDRGTLAIRDFSSIAIASYGAQAADPHAISRVISRVVTTTGLDAIGPDVLRKTLPETPTDQQWIDAALARGATLLANGSITERDGRLIAEVSVVDLHDPTKIEKQQLTTDRVDIPELLDNIGEWLAQRARPAARLDRTPNRNRSNELLGMASLEIRDRNWFAARAYLEQAVHTDRSSAEAWDQLAGVCARMGAPAAVTTSVYERAVERAPEGPRKHILRGALLTHQNKPRAALAELTPLEAAHLTGDDLRDLLFQLGEAHWHEGHHDIGFGYFKRVVTEFPTFTDAAQHAGEYTLARRDITNARVFLANQHVTQEWAEFAAGHYKELAATGREGFNRWAQEVLELPISPRTEPMSQVEHWMEEISAAAAANDRPALDRSLDAMLAFLATQPVTGGTANDLILVAEVTIGAGLADESRRVLAALHAQAPGYNYKRLSILASPMLGNPGFADDDLTGRLQTLARANEAEIAGDRKRAAELLTKLVRDPTWEWDFPERIALVRNLRALGRTREADEICADTLRPVLVRYAFFVARRYCRGR